MVASAIVRHKPSARCTNRRRIRGTSGRVALDDKQHAGRTYWLESTVAGQTFRCCRGCAYRESWVVREYIRNGLRAVPVGTYVGQLTITEGSEPRSVQAHAEAVSRFLESVWEWLGPLPYCAVREFQQRGAVHTHVLIIGWPKVDLERVSQLAARQGLGQTSLRGTFRIGSGGMQYVGGKWRRIDNVAAYLAKVFGNYFAKSADVDHWQQYVDLMPKGYRQVHHGGGWPSTLTETREAQRGQSERALKRSAWEARIREWWHVRDALGPELARTVLDAANRCATTVSTVEGATIGFEMQDPLLAT